MSQYARNYTIKGSGEERAPRRMVPAAVQMMGNEEKAKLSIMASQAFAVFILTEDGAAFLELCRQQGMNKTKALDYWRRSQVKVATRTHPDGAAAGLSQAKRTQFNTIMRHFAVLAGQDGRAFNAGMKEGRQSGPAGRHGDDQEDIRQGRARVWSVVNAMGPHFGGAVGAMRYAESESRRKYGGRAIELLTAAELDVMRIHLTNRLNAKAGRGNAGNRHKAQRRAAKGPKAPTPETPELPRTACAPPAQSGGRVCFTIDPEA